MTGLPDRWTADFDASPLDAAELDRLQHLLERFRCYLERNMARHSAVDRADLVTLYAAYLVVFHHDDGELS